MTTSGRAVLLLLLLVAGASAGLGDSGLLVAAALVAAAVVASAWLAERDQRRELQHRHDTDRAMRAFLERALRSRRD